MMPLPSALEALAPGHYRFQVEADHHVFQGHFPKEPIVPGLAQVDWAIQLGERDYGPLGAFTGISNLKFQRIIVPDEAIELRLTPNPVKHTLAFEFQGADGRKSSGTLTFESRP
ncbi:Beta-hydroxyacyl-(acyl-carrier-protein) dehydratase FabA/FabZ [Holophaga foetida]|uniref:ApeI family dehydratase n=1 Tax=Holophaga foetida TaxID=35839 RepID=UPI0002471CA0|nr:Beta-hydroxyacyl-(acyl-carrier-protein) dehydratase FabA/FabZ [Holophaga foetida]